MLWKKKNLRKIKTFFRLHGQNMKKIIGGISRLPHHGPLPVWPPLLAVKIENIVVFFSFFYGRKPWKTFLRAALHVIEWYIIVNESVISKTTQDTRVTNIFHKRQFIKFDNDSYVFCLKTTWYIIMSDLLVNYKYWLQSTRRHWFV